jgi:hypothetical protein
MSTCYCDPNPAFKPAMRLIAAITNGYPAEVTTTFAHGYISGNIVRLIIPIPCQMIEANQLSGTITVTGLTTFIIDIDTTNFTPFIAPVLPTPNPHDNTCALVVPIGEINDMISAAVNNTKT